MPARRLLWLIPLLPALAAALGLAIPAFAGELDREFKGSDVKVRGTATAPATEVASTRVSGTELDDESPTQAWRRHGWGGGWGHGYRGWGGGWGVGYRSWYRPSYGFYGGLGYWPSYYHGSFYASYYPSYAYSYYPSWGYATYAYPGWGYYW